MKIQSFKTLLLPVSVLALVSSCSNSDFPGYEKAENGLHYKFFVHNEGAPKVQEGDDIYIYYRISRYDTDSVLYDTRKFSRDGSGYHTFNFDRVSFKGSFEDGMKMMAKGDSAEFVISADSFYLKSNGMNELPKGWKPGLYLKGIFAVKDITPKKEVEARRKMEMEKRKAFTEEMKAKEQPSIDKFIADNKLNAKPTKSGLIFIEEKKGTGPNPTMEDLVTVHYTGKFLDGRVFDSSIERKQPAKFSLNQVIPGWSEGLQMMKKGGKAKMLIPSSLGYGENGSQGVIPPYAPLYFEVELLDIEKMPAANSMPAQQHSANDGHGH